MSMILYIFETCYVLILSLYAHPVVWYSAAISLMSLLPAILGSELGFRRWYIRFLVDLFDWATHRIERYEEDHEDDPDEVEETESSNQQRFEYHIIDKQSSVQSLGRLRRHSTMEKPEHIQLSEDAIYFINSGIEAIIDDEVTQCFRPEQLSGWNLLGISSNAFTNGKIAHLGHRSNLKNIPIWDSNQFEKRP